MTLLGYWLSLSERSLFQFLSQAFSAVLILGLLYSALVVRRLLGRAVEQLKMGVAWSQVCKRDIFPSLYRSAVIFFMPLALAMPILVSEDLRPLPFLLPVYAILALLSAAIPALLGSALFYACALENPERVASRVTLIGIPVALWLGLVALWAAAGR